MKDSINYYLSRLKRDELTIFLFHGIINKHKHFVQNYSRKHIDQFRFRNILNKLKEKGKAISMSDAVKHIINKKPFPSYSYVISFDDGFENNFSLAAPILTEMNIPAIFYVTTNFIDSNAMSWTDKMEICIDKTSSGTLNFEWDKNYDYSFQNEKFSKGSEMSLKMIAVLIFNHLFQAYITNVKLKRLLAQMMICTKK